MIDCKSDLMIMTLMRELDEYCLIKVSQTYLDVSQSTTYARLVGDKVALITVIRA